MHYERAFASGKGFDDVVQHGLLTGSMLCEIGGQFGWLATGMSFRFVRPVYAGDTITCRLTITEIDDDGRRASAAVSCRNQHGQPVVEATLQGHLPLEGERAILADMLRRGDPTNKLHR